jgi:type II secretory pathway component PulF
MGAGSSAAFYGQLATTLDSGLAIPRAVVLAAGKGPYRQRAEAAAAACLGGASLAESLAEQGEHALAVALLRAGERSGHLAEHCRSLAAIYTHQQQLRQQLLSKLAYPAALVHLALLIPGLPGLVLGKHGIGTLLAPVLTLDLLLLAAYGALRVGLLASNLPARAALLPVLRGITLPLVTSRLCMALGSCLKAGMLLHEALAISSPTCGNRVIADRINALSEAILRGESLDLTTAAQRAGLAHLVVSHIASAEAAGRLDHELPRLAVAERLRGEERLQWAIRVLTGTIYLGALLFAAWTVVNLWINTYGAALQAASE